MLKASNENFVFLGLDAENVRRLKDGQPIMVDEPLLGIGKKIVIAYDEDLNNLKNKLQEGRLGETR